MMAIFVEMFGAYGLTISESKPEAMSTPIPPVPATQIFNSMGQQYLLPADINQGIRPGRMSFRRYTRELYDLLKRSLRW